MKQWKRIVIMAIFAALVTFWSGAPANAESLEFYQLDFNLDGTITLNSDWGVVDLTFTGSDTIVYFNLTVNGTWQVQDMPVLSLEGSGVNQTQRFWFDLGNEVGTNVTDLYYVSRLTTAPLLSAPPYVDSIYAQVRDDSVVVYSNCGCPFNRTPPPAKPTVGGTVSDEKQHKLEGFETQECGRYDCVPAAISNSLKFLKKRHGLNINDDDITIDKMKEACGWVDGVGVPPGTEWWDLKDEYMKKKKLPITTERRVAKENIDWVIQQIDIGQDVEMTVRWQSGGFVDYHCVALVGIAKLDNGKYSITVAHDAKQKDRVPQSGVWDPNADDEFTDGFLSHWQQSGSFVVECPASVLVGATPQSAPTGTPATITVKNNGTEPIQVTEITVHRPGCQDDVKKLDPPVTIGPGDEKSWKYPDEWGGQANVNEGGKYKVKVTYNKDIVETTFERYAGVIPTLTEWGLIIFGVVLIGFITYVFLRRRKAVVSLR